MVFVASVWKSLAIRITDSKFKGLDYRFKLSVTYKINQKLMMKNNTSIHILNASSNLLGFCFVILTSIKFLKLSERTYIDETVTIALVFFMLSCILSFLSIRGNIKSNGRFESVADYFFLGGMGILFLTAVLILFNVISWSIRRNTFYCLLSYLL